MSVATTRSCIKDCQTNTETMKAIMSLKTPKDRVEYAAPKGFTAKHFAEALKYEQDSDLSGFESKW